MTEKPLDPNDPSNSAVVPGASTTEYLMSRNALVLSGILALGAFVLVGRGKLDVTGLLVVLSIAVGGGASVATVARGYVTNRTQLKRDVAKGASDVAVAQAEAAAPKKPGAGFVGESLIGTEVDVDDRPNAHRSEIGFTGRVRP